MGGNLWSFIERFQHAWFILCCTDLKSGGCACSGMFVTDFACPKSATVVILMTEIQLTFLVGSVSSLLDSGFQLWSSVATLSISSKRSDQSRLSKLLLISSKRGFREMPNGLALRKGVVLHPSILPSRLRCILLD
eukprot:2075671-Rhodomonas_salina.3